MGSGVSMSHIVEPPLTPRVAEAKAQGRGDKRSKWRMFGIGLAVRLLGLELIWLGDGSSTMFRKGMVVLGVILSVGGITVLRYLLISGFRNKK